MAFDMYAGARHEAIQSHEEYLFAFSAEAITDFPQLNAIRAKFYSDFTLGPEQSSELTHEILTLHERYENQGGKAFSATALRLAQFFSYS
ncbi:hypothetical protein ACFPTX_20705 [Pseudomonas sp. GCM10022188]|uniref:hypothetical protein n=1 Tax=Pseudomonas TaxID=286 RepID=UPI001E3B36E3|nr:hypothetical protein [Pseudomonas oryzagri]MCC6075411.1 hypothetical protein [Pseudomonas oryzagri]